MLEVSVRELRNRTGDVVRRVEGGETVTLTVHGRPVADIVPHRSRRESIPADELVERITARLGDSPREPLPRVLDDVTTDGAVEDLERRRRDRGT